MRYWVYINDKVDGPHNESDLVTLRGFTPDTLICSEESASSGNQQWMKASSVFEFDQEPAGPFGGGMDQRTKEQLFSKLDALMDEFAQLRSRLNDMEARLEQKIDQVPDATIGKTKLETISNAHSILAEETASNTFSENDKLENTTELVAQAEDIVASANQETQNPEETLEPAKDDLVIQSAMDSMYNAQLAQEAENTFQDLLSPVQAEKLAKEAEGVVEEKIPAETTPTEEDAQRDALIKEITSPDQEDVIDQIIEEKKEEKEEEFEDLMAVDAVPAPEEQAEEPAVEQVTEEPALEPVAEEQAEEPALEPVAEEQAEEPTLEPVAEEQAEEPTLDPVAEEQAEEPALEPVAEEQAEEPAVEQVTEEQAEEPALEPVAEEQAEEPVLPVAEEQAEEPALEPVAEEQAEEPALEPVAEEQAEEPAQAQQDLPSLDDLNRPQIDLSTEEPALEPVAEEQVQEPVVEEQKEESFEELIPTEQGPKQEDEGGLLSDTDLELAKTDLSLELSEGVSVKESAEEQAQEQQGEPTMSSLPEDEQQAVAETTENNEQAASFTDLMNSGSFEQPAEEQAEQPAAEEEPATEEQAEQPAAEEEPATEEQAEEQAEQPAQEEQAEEDFEGETMDAGEMTEIQLQEGSTYLISDFVPSADPEKSLEEQLASKDVKEDTFASQDVQDMLASFVKVREDESEENEQKGRAGSDEAILNLEDPLKDRRGASYDIRTVPMVQDPTDTERLNVEALSENDDVNMQHEVKSEQNTPSNLNKIIISILVALLLAVGLYFVLAFMHMIPDSVNVLGAKKAAPVSEQVVNEIYEEPAAVIAEEVPAAPKEITREEIVMRLQNYLLPNGRMLREFIEQKHATIDPSLITWDAAPVNADEYLVNIKVPPATPQSFKITYRFNYNAQTNALVPTISDSKALMAEARGM